MSQPEWLTLEEVAAALRVNRETVRRWIRRGTLTALALPSRQGGYRIRRDELERFIRERTGKTLT